MLTQMMSGGRHGRRCLLRDHARSARQPRDRAATLAPATRHRSAPAAEIFFTVMMLAVRPPLFSLLGGRGGVLEQAAIIRVCCYSGAVSIWLVNTLASVFARTGDMRLPSRR